MVVIVIENRKAIKMTIRTTITSMIRIKITIMIDAYVKSPKTPSPLWERGGVRVKSIYILIIQHPPPLCPLPRGEGKYDFLRMH